MKKNYIVRTLILVLCFLLCLGLAACNMGGDGNGNGADTTVYSANDEVAMAISRVKNATYTPDLAAIAGEKFTAAATTSEDATTSDASVPHDSVPATTSQWITRLNYMQESADDWGARAKATIFAYIDKAKVFDKWVRTSDIGFGDPSYYCFMLHYDEENDVVTVYDDFNAYSYYFDENGNEVIEVYSYARKDENDDSVGLSFMEYGKYVKGVSYTYVDHRFNYANIENVDGQLNSVSFEYDEENGVKLEILKQYGNKAIFYFDNMLDYLIDGNKLFGTVNDNTGDYWATNEQHPVTYIEFALNILDGYTSLTPHDGYMCELYNGTEEITTQSFHPITSSADINKYHYGNNFVSCSPMLDLTYLAPGFNRSGMLGGTLSTFKYESVDWTDKTNALYISDEYVTNYYDFLNIYDSYYKDKTALTSFRLLGISDPTGTGLTAFLNKIIETFRSPFMESFDSEAVTYLTPDQIAGETATMFTPTISAGSTSAAVSGQKLTVSMSGVTVNAAKNALLESGAEYRAEIGYTSSNTVFEAGIASPIVTYAGEDMSFTLNGSAEVSAPFVFDVNYSISAYVAKKINGVWTKISAAELVPTTMTANAETELAQSGAYSVKYGAVVLGNKLAVNRTGYDTEAPVVKVDNVTLTSTANASSYTIGTGDTAVIINYQCVVSRSEQLSDLIEKISVTDNLDGSLALSLANFAQYTVAEENVFELSANPYFNAYTNTLLYDAVILTVTDSAGNTIRVALFLP